MGVYCWCLPPIQVCLNAKSFEHWILLFYIYNNWWLNNFQAFSPSFYPNYSPSSISQTSYPSIKITCFSFLSIILSDLPMHALAFPHENPWLSNHHLTSDHFSHTTFGRFLPSQLLPLPVEEPWHPQAAAPARILPRPALSHATSCVSLRDKGRKRSIKRQPWGRGGKDGLWWN